MESWRMNRAVFCTVVSVLIASVFGCSKTPSTNAATQVVESAAGGAGAVQSASQRLKAVTWIGLDKDGARQSLRFGDDGKVVVSQVDPKRSPITHTYIYRIVKEEGDRLTLHFADELGTSVSGIHVTVARGLDFSPGGAFEMNGHYDPE
jgi:hypothetical protein